MKKILATIVALGLLTIAGNASAITFTDNYDPNDFKMSSHLFSPDDTHSWQFNLLDDGYDPLTMEITSATIGLSLRDDNDWWLEYADLNVGTQTFSWEVDTGTSSFIVSSLLTLSSTGLLDVSLKADAGDFWFQSSSLTAEGDYSAAAVPEPTTMLLFGTGLLGLVGYNRKRSNKRS